MFVYLLFSFAARLYRPPSINVAKSVPMIYLLNIMSDFTEDYSKCISTMFCLVCFRELHNPFSVKDEYKHQNKHYSNSKSKSSDRIKNSNYKKTLLKYLFCFLTIDEFSFPFKNWARNYSFT